MEFDKKICPIVDVDGFIEKGKQFDIEVNLPEVKMKENLFLILLQTKKVNLFLDHFVQTNSTKYKFGLIK